MRLEIRSNSLLVEGYVNVTSRDSRILNDDTGEFVEQVEPKTFQRALERNPVDILLDHDKSRKLGDTTTNLALSEDNIGLYAKAEITDADVIRRAKDGKLKGWSFGFIKNKDRKEATTIEGRARRFLEDIILKEVSIISDLTPIYTGTSIETRADETGLELRAFDDVVEVFEIKKEFVNYDAIKESNEILKIKQIKVV